MKMNEREEATYKRVYEEAYKASQKCYAVRVREAHDAAMKAVRELRR